MPVLYNQNQREFHLYNSEISYVIKIMENGQLGQLYYGKHIHHRENFSHLLELCVRDMAPCAFEGRCDFSLEHIKQEYPAFGTGDMRYPAYQIRKKNGSRNVDFQYVSHRIYKGKPQLKGLPATYTETDDEAETLEIHLKDEKNQTCMILTYTIYEEFPVIAKSVRFFCENEDGIVLEHVMSGCMDLPDKEYKMLTLSGAWGRERHLCVRDLQYGIQSVYSMRGCSSHQHNPFLALMRKNADESQGEVIGFSLVYSGSFLAQAEVDNFDVVRVILGIHPNTLEWHLEKGEEFQSPELVMVYSKNGLNGMSQTYHELYRTRLARGNWREKERPILINNWEATYWDFDEDKILSLAEKAKKIGMELFVLDDGWFGKRDNSKSSLGDWYPYTRKLPDGVAGLAKKINEMGMKFGIWIEPEMVSKDSDLYRAHLDWVFSEKGWKICHSRNQYVLDFSKQEVRDCIFEMIDKLLSEAPISYVKWDMNRSFSETFSNGMDAEYQGKAQHKYILGVYEFYERLIEKHPDVLFESCASGGARFDPGMLYYAPQGWISDDTDAVERLKIQYGTSIVYPLSSMGSHVSASPNHQMYRHTSLDTRANVAYFGTFGYEMDLNQASDEELEKMREQIQFMKIHRKLLHQGHFYRLESPFDGNYTAWMVVSKDKKSAIVGYYKILQTINNGFKRLKLQGLLKNQRYEIEDTEEEYFGDELMENGLIVSDSSSGKTGITKKQQGDFSSWIFILKAKEM